MNKACSLLCLVSLAVAQAPLLIAENFESIVAPVVPYKRYGNGTLVELRDGRILLAYNEWTELGETRDSSPANVSARISEDGGRTWGRPSVLHEITSRESFGRVGPPSLLRLRNGEIGFIYGELDSYSDYPYYFKRSSDEGRTWSRAVRITGDPAYYILNNHRVIQLKSGRLLAPFSYIPDARKYYGSPLDARGSRHGGYTWEGFCYLSDDNGASWRRGKGVVKLPKFPTGVQEPGLVELNDGAVMMIIRSVQEHVYKSFSRDAGETWTDPEPIKQLVAPRSPAAITRIPQTGDLAIVWNYSPKIVRSPLAIAISHDEGQTWGNIKYLETGYHYYHYPALLSPKNRDQLLLCYKVGTSVESPLGSLGSRWATSGGEGLKLRGIDIDWLYSAP